MPYLAENQKILENFVKNIQKFYIYIYIYIYITFKQPQAIWVVNKRGLDFE